MKRFLLVIVSSLLMTVVFAEGINSSSVLGKWYTAEDKTIVEIRQENDKFLGKIIWLREPMSEDDPAKVKIDDKNPDESLSARPIQGIEFLKDFTFNEKDNKWVNGVIYNPEDGKTYYCYMIIEEDGRLFVRGSLDAWGWIGKTQYWTRESSLAK